MHACLQKVWGWLATYKDQIGSLAAIIGVMIGFVGFTLTVWQIHETATALRAGNSYTIEDNARQLINQIENRGYVRKLISNTLPADQRTGADYDLWRMFNFYLAVYRQAKAGGVGREFKQDFRADFCGFLKWKAVSDEWDVFVKQNRLSDQNVAMRGAWCDTK
jgi:hypothetical protein